MKTNFEPRGKVKALVDTMRASSRPVWSADDVIKVMDIPKKNIPAYLGACFDHKVIHRHLYSGNSFFSLQPIPQDWRPDEPLRIPTLRKPGEWRPPVMTPPRGAQRIVEPRETIWPVATPAPTPVPQPIVVAAPIEPEPPQETEEAAEFNAALWADGDLFLYGLEELEDGSGHKLAAEHVPALKRLLAGVTA